jgi:hypothetical protein
MPMKETTQANATAKTAFGWRNGLTVEDLSTGRFYLTLTSDS